MPTDTPEYLPRPAGYEERAAALVAAGTPAADAEAFDRQAHTARIKSSQEHIRNYYGLDLRVGLAVKHKGRPGVIVGFNGQYVQVRLDGDAHATTCHATDGMEYPREAHIGPGPDERSAHLVQTP